MCKIYQPRTPDGEKLKTCLSTINIYLSKFRNPKSQFLILLDNILKEPKNEKKRSINLSNAAFNRRVGNILGGKNILKEVGFVDELGFYKLKEVKESELK